MDFEENLINQYNQLKSREDIKSGQHMSKLPGKRWKLRFKESPIKGAQKSKFYKQNTLLVVRIKLIPTASERCFLWKQNLKYEQ